MSFQAMSMEILCPDHPLGNEEDRYRNYCNESGELVRVDRLFSDPSKLSKSVFYENGQRVSVKIYNIDQEQTYEGDIEELSDGSYIKTSYSVEPFRAYIKKKTHVRDIPGQVLPLKLAEWIYEENENKTDSRLVLYLEYVEGTDIPLFKIFYDDNEEVEFYEEYTVNDPSAQVVLDVRVVGVRRLNRDQQVISDYSSQGPVRFDELYEENSWPAPKPLGVVVIDSGFETDHPDLVSHWYQNPKETFDGFDNDGNGLVDDVYGVNQVQGGEPINDLRESFLFNDKLRPIISHGTHVASLAMDGIERWSLAGFAGNYTNPAQLARIGEFIKTHKARFVNMSFSFETPGGMAPPRESFIALEELIESQSDALFFIAAGNSVSDLDEFPKFPAGWQHDNMVVVGALAAAEWQETPDPEYAIKADFSSYGKQSADIFAPGTDVMAAFLGGSYGPLSGTSMATPKALNVVARVAESFPGVSGKDLKTALLISAYIPDIENPLPCVSGGVVYEKRMREVLELKIKGLSFKEAALQVRQEGAPLVGESQDETYFAKLENFWSQAQLF